MKLEYQLLTKSGPWFKSMAQYWSNNVESLKQVTNLLLYESLDVVKYEAILQLSLFILMPDRSEKISNLLAKNSKIYVGEISPFRPNNQESDFQEIKTKILNKL